MGGALGNARSSYIQKQKIVPLPFTVRVGGVSLKHGKTISVSVGSIVCVCVCVRTCVCVGKCASIEK